MNVEFMCGLLANYSKELYEAETIRERGDVQLKHAKMILDKVENCSIPAVVFLPGTKLPEKECEDEPESVEVGVIIEGEHFTAYYNYDDEYWWVHFGGITAGHTKLDDYDVEGWYYLAKNNCR